MAGGKFRFLVLVALPVALAVGVPGGAGLAAAGGPTQAVHEQAARPDAPHLTVNCDPPASDVEAASAPDTELVDKIVRTYGEGQYLGRALGVPIEVLKDKKRLSDDPSTLAFACAFHNDKKVTKCVMHLEPFFYNNDRAEQISTLAHETFHCFQYTLSSWDRWDSISSSSTNNALDWLIEGQAEWAGDTIAATMAPGYVDPWWQKYLESPTQGLFDRTYNALGFYSQVNAWDSGVAWSVLDPMLTAAEDNIRDGVKAANRAAYEAALPTDPSLRRDFLDSWASSYFRVPALGPAWDISGPATPDDSVNGQGIARPLGLLGNGSGINVEVDPYSNDLLLGMPSADVVEMKIDVGTVAFANSGTGDTFVFSQDEALCTRSDGCACPGTLDTTVSEPGSWLIGVNGGTEYGAKVHLQGESLSNYCAQQKEPPDPTSGCDANSCGSAGGDVHLSTFDDSLYDFQAAGEFTLLQTTGRHGTGLDVQERMQPLTSARYITWPTAIAMRVGQAHLGFYANNKDGRVTVRLGNRAITVRRAVRLPGGGVLRYQPVAGFYWVTFPDGSIVFVFAELPWLGAEIELNTVHRGHVTGLLGTWNGHQNADLTTRAGRLVRLPMSFHEEYKVYANGWRITQKSSLFYYAKGKSTKTYTDLSIPRYPVTVASLPAAKRKVGKLGCGDAYPGAGIDYQPYRNDCIIDVALTGNKKLANNWLAAEEKALTGNFSIKIGTTVLPNSPRDAGRVAVPGAQQIYSFHGKKGQVIEVVSNEHCSISVINDPDQTQFWLYGPDDVPYALTDLCNNIGPVRLTATGQYQVTVNALQPGFGVSKITEPYSISVEPAAVQTFPIKIGTTVRAGSPRGAGRLAAPYTEQIFTFQGNAGEKITLRSRTPCTPGTPGTTAMWFSDAGPGYLTMPLCDSMGTTTLPYAGTFHIEVNAGIGNNYDGQTDWGTQASTGTYSFSLTKG